MRKIIILSLLTGLFAGELEVEGDLKVSGNIDAQNQAIKNPKTDIVYKFPIKTADELIWNKHMEKRDKYLDFLNDMGEGEAIKKTSLQEMMLDRDILKSQQTYYSVEIDKTKEK